MKYSAVLVMDGNVMEWDTDDFRQVYKLGTIFTRVCKRNKLKMRFKVFSNTDGDCLLRFYNMPISSSGNRDVARLSRFCKYGRVCGGINF